ncbi:MAG: CRISPR-associated protein Csx19 [bacterium]|nr:CRISPR-associated protein Csx19 [bacterium]
MKSKAEPYSKSDFNSLVKHWGNDDGYFVAYLDYMVLIGKFCDGDFQGERFEPKFIQKMRLFNKSKELYLWRQDENIFSGRLRVDEADSDVDAIDAWQVLYGTRCEEKSGETLLSEERGTNLAIPFIGLNEKVDMPIRIRTRNYIGCNDLGQAGYEDCRFVEFTNKNMEPLGAG